MLPIVFALIVVAAALGMCESTVHAERVIQFPVRQRHPGR
jgi:hypothetical protein